MSETQPGLDSLQQARPGDASFFIGRKGLRLPKVWLELPDEDSPVQPVTDLFDVMSGIWQANGYQTGRVLRHDVIELPPAGYNVHALLFSNYIGKSDKELEGITLPLDRSGAKLRQLQHGDTIQGVENFAISIPPKIQVTGLSPRMSAGRVSLLLSRTHHFHAEIANAGLRTGSAPPEYSIVPDEASESTFAFLGTQPIKQSAEAGQHIHEYTNWIAHYLVSELLADHST